MSYYSAAGGKQEEKKYSHQLIGPPANADGTAKSMIVLIKPVEDAPLTRLTLSYQLVGAEYAWYWQYYYRNLNHYKGKDSFTLFIVCFFFWALLMIACCLVCLRHYFLRRICPRLCGYPEDT